MTNSAETIKAVQGYLNRGFELMNEATAQFQHAAMAFAGMADDGGKPERVLFCSPVTGQIETGENIWGTGWFITTNYGDYYTATGKPAYHPGVDLNLPNYADSGKPVYASADGEMVFTGVVSGWQGQMVVIEHVLETDQKVWTRYAHIRDVPHIGQIRVPVKRGEIIGHIADYLPTGPANDHLDFSVCFDDLGARPGDWPGLDKARVIASYRNPHTWLKERST